MKDGGFIVNVKESLTGRIFGELEVLRQTSDYIAPSGKHMAQWVCQCSCGSEPIIVPGNNLKSQKTKSCGCLSAKTTSKYFKKYNQYDLSGEHGIGWTNNTNKEFYFDLKYYDKIKNYCWYENKQGLTSRLQTKDTKTNKIIRMHILLGYKNYDHIDRNELNNLESNLRPCTSQENNRNRTKKQNTTSNFIGVCFDKSRNKWMAYINIEKQKTKILGRFTDLSDAIITRLKAEKEYYGEFAPQQNLFEKYNIVSNEMEDKDGSTC